MKKKFVLILLISIISIFMLGCDFERRPLKERIEASIKSSENFNNE